MFFAEAPNFMAVLMEDGGVQRRPLQMGEAAILDRFDDMFITPFLDFDFSDAGGPGICAFLVCLVRYLLTLYLTYLLCL